MSGFFDKLKGKKEEWDAKQEEKKVVEIQEQIEKNFASFKKDFGKELGKLGITLTYLGLSGADAKARNAGFIVARFNDKRGYPITLVQTQAVYEGTPHGALAQMRMVYFSAAIWGTTVQASTPATLLFKETSKGFMKGMEKSFLPLPKLVSNEKQLPSSPNIQAPLISALSSDKNLCDSISNALALSFQQWLTHKSYITVSCPDAAGKCVIVPAGDETAIFLRNYGGLDYRYGDPKKILEIISKIRTHIVNHPHPEKVIGLVPAPWINTMYALVKAKSPET